MSADLVSFDTALPTLASHVFSFIGQDLTKGRFIRDVFGRLTFIAPPGGDPAAVGLIKRTLPSSCQPFVAGENWVVPGSSPLAHGFLKESGTVHRLPDLGRDYILLDRRLAGEDWLKQPPPAPSSIQRIAFYSLKGGVGRSTALAVSAAYLAAQGLNILVIDLDLEAPGLGSILLRQDQQPDLGVLDWFTTGALGIDASSLVPDMIGGSPFTGSSGVIDVVPVIGTLTERHPANFLAKLARAYTPGAAGGRLATLSFTEKVEVLIRDLTGFRRYDAVLLDVRAGLNETSAASIIGLGARCLLFGTASSQTILDYRILFAAIRQSMESWPDSVDLRDRMRMVHGRAAAAPNERAAFRSMSWELWLESLYDESGGLPDNTEYSFDLDDEQGPHYPWVIPNSDAYFGFDPRLDVSHLGESTYWPVYGEFLLSLRGLISAQGVA